MKNLKNVICGLLVCTSIPIGLMGATPSVYGQEVERAHQTLDSLYAHYSVEGTCLLRENYPYNAAYKAGYLASEEQQQAGNPYSYLWPYSGTFSAVGMLLKATKDKAYKTLLDGKVLPGLEAYFDVGRKPEAYASYINTAALSDRFYDDNIWLGIDFAECFLAEGDEHYLQKAQLIWKFIESGQDDKLGGGIYWCEQKKESKHTCSNAPGTVFALRLYEATGHTDYLEKAKKLYGWTRHTLQDPADKLYYDNISLDGKLGKAKFTYNSGQMMQAAVLLYTHTGDNRFLADAQDLAKACFDYFFTDYTSADGKTFKMLKKGDVWFAAVMLRGFAELYAVDRNPDYLNAFRNCLDYAWHHARDEKGLFNSDLSGSTSDGQKWLLTQAAMVEMYARLAFTTKID